jgi:hypothetical protein
MAALAADAALADRIARRAVAAIARSGLVAKDLDAFEEVARYVARQAG